MKSIILHDWEVRGILEGRISQLRRPIKPQPPKQYEFVEIKEDRAIFHLVGKPPFSDVKINGRRTRMLWFPYGSTKSPFGQVGDLIWGKETFAFCEAAKLCKPNDIGKECQDHWKNIGYIWYRADGEQTNGGKTAGEHLNGRGEWRSSSSMPRWASRIILQTDEIWVEQLQKISEENAKLMGVTPSIVGEDFDYLRYRAGLQTLWDSIYKKQGLGWETNPWAFAAKVHRVEA